MKTCLKIMHCAFLTACLLTLFAACSSGCASTATEASAGEYIDDSVITTKVKTALLKNDATPGGAIKVESFKGVVQLSGFVDAASQKTRVGEVAGSTEGVRDVVNNILVT